MTILEKAYEYADAGDSKSALSVILHELEKLLALGMKDVAIQFASSVDIDRIGEIALFATRLMDLRK